MEFKEVLEMVYKACEEVGFYSGDTAIIKSATKIYIAGMSEPTKEEPAKLSDSEKLLWFINEYKEKILDSYELSAHDWTTTCKILNDIELFAVGRFKF